MADRLVDFWLADLKAKPGNFDWCQVLNFLNSQHIPWQIKINTKGNFASRPIYKVITDKDSLNLTLVMQDLEQTLPESLINRVYSLRYGVAAQIWPLSWDKPTAAEKLVRVQKILAESCSLPKTLKKIPGVLKVQDLQPRTIVLNSFKLGQNLPNRLGGKIFIHDAVLITIEGQINLEQIKEITKGFYCILKNKSLFKLGFSSLGSPLAQEIKVVN